MKLVRFKTAERIFVLILLINSITSQTVLSAEKIEGEFEARCDVLLVKNTFGERLLKVKMGDRSVVKELMRTKYLERPEVRADKTRIGADEILRLKTIEGKEDFELLELGETEALIRLGGKREYRIAINRSGKSEYLVAVSGKKPQSIETYRSTMGILFEDSLVTEDDALEFSIRQNYGPIVKINKTSFRQVGLTSRDLFLMLGQRKALPREIIEKLNPKSFEWVEFLEGEFMMGSPDAEAVIYGDESQHLVKIETPFQLSKTLMTWGQLLALYGPEDETLRNIIEAAGIKEIGTNLLNMPVTHLKRSDEYAIAEHLSVADTMYDYFLPKEDQWEYAARAGTGTVRHWGETMQGAARYAVFGQKEVTEVATKEPNGAGLYDTIGLLREITGTGDIVRSGAFNDDARYLCVTGRNYINGYYRCYGVGLRLARQRKRSASKRCAAEQKSLRAK